MFRKRLAAMFMPIFIAGAGVAFISAPTLGRADTSEKENTEKLSETFSALHAVAQWSVNLSQMAEKKAKSELVKGFARDVVTGNSNADAKLLRVAQKEGISVGPLDPKTEAGKSIRDRLKGETALLASLEGDAFDKEYMTLVTNTQQSVIHVLESSKAMAKDPEVKKYLNEMTTNVQNRLKIAQGIMATVYGNKI